MFKKIFIAAALLGASTGLLAQASPTAVRSASLQAGIGYSNASTDYVPQRANGITAYFDYDFYRHLGLEGEFRFVKEGQSNIYEKTYQVGPRYSRTYHQRFSPYVKAMYGRGVFNFTYRGQTTANIAYNMLALGGGLDYRVLPYLNIRGDYEYQRWFGFPPNGLTPSVVTVGVAYRFR